VTKKKTLSKFPSANVVNLKTGRPLKRLIHMFTNTSSIKQSKNDIAIYIKVSEWIIYQILKAFSFLEPKTTFQATHSCQFVSYSLAQGVWYIAKKPSSK